MDKGVFATLKMLSARQISVRSADRILRALELLQMSEEGKGTGDLTRPLIIEGQEVVAAGREEVEEVTQETQEAKEGAVKLGMGAVSDRLLADIVTEEEGITNSADPTPNRYHVRALVCIGVFAAFALTGLALFYEAELEELQARVYEQTIETERLGSEIQEYRDLMSTFSKKGKRKPLGIFTVTAYDPIKSCKPFDDGITSKGIPAGMGVAAVDPRVIPYGSVLYLPELGRYFFASDTGSAMKRRGGRNIDLLMPTVEDALQFGRRRLQVELIDLSAS